MNRIFLSCAALLAATLSASAEMKTFTPSDDGRIEFDSPSSNLCCTFSEDVTYYPEGSGTGPLLTCTRVAPKYWIVELRPNSEIIHHKDPGEVPGCGYGTPLGNVLGYGDTWQMGPYNCKMATNGVTCTTNGKGFRLSRKGLKKVY